MRRTILAAAAIMALAAAALAPGRAEAAAIAPIAPVGVQAAIGDGLAQDVAYVCRRVWRCGPYGCGWRRACWWTGPSPYYYGGGPYWHGRYGYHRWHRW